MFKVWINEFSVDHLRFYSGVFRVQNYSNLQNETLSLVKKATRKTEMKDKGYYHKGKFIQIHLKLYAC